MLLGRKHLTHICSDVFMTFKIAAYILSLSRRDTSTDIEP